MRAASLLLLAACAGSGQVSPGIPSDTGSGPTSPGSPPVTTDPLTLPETDPVCGPVLQGDPHVLEGEAVAVTATCATGADPLAVGLSWIAPGFTVDGATARWTPGLADAGLRTVLVQVPVAGGVPETATLTVSVADAWADPANVPVDPAMYTEEWGVPVLHLLPDVPITQSDTPMTAWWQGVAYTGSAHIRGAASASYPKNNYTLEFEPTQLAIEGAPDKDHLVLISNFDDNSYMRQRLVFDTWAEMAAAAGEDRVTVSTWFVVVYIGGAYSGLYLAADHVDDELMGESGLDPAGNLYKSVTHDANFYFTDASGRAKSDLAVGWEKKEGADLADYSDLDALTQWSASVSDAQFAAEVGGWLPVTEFGDWFLLVHHTAADDSAGKNAYLYDDPSTGPWWRYCPWDFNQSFGQSWTTARSPATEYNDFTWNNGIFAHIEREPGLSADLWDRYRTLRAAGGPLSADWELAQLDAMQAQIDDGARRDWEKWGPTYRSYWGWRGDIVDYDGEVAYLRQWIVDREAYMAVADP